MDAMRWLVVGAEGMLGHDVVARLRREGYAVTATRPGALDITDHAAVREAVPGHDVVVNCAAWTDVDGAEEHEEQATSVNADGPRHLAAACRDAGARLVHLSTDYVFDGTARTPYAEDAEPCPVSAYGRSKAAGERAVREELPDGHLLLRTAWLYGAHGRCFPRTIARLLRERGAAQVVGDQVGQPTWAADVADLAVRLVLAGAPAGTYHATASGETSWWGFAREVARSVGVDPGRVDEVTSADFPRPAPRPAYSVLGHGALLRAGVAPIGDWRDRWRVAADQVLSAEQ